MKRHIAKYSRLATLILFFSFIHSVTYAADFILADIEEIPSGSFVPWDTQDPSFALTKQQRVPVTIDGEIVTVTYDYHINNHTRIKITDSNGNTIVDQEPYDNGKGIYFSMFELHYNCFWENGQSTKSFLVIRADTQGNHPPTKSLWIIGKYLEGKTVVFLGPETLQKTNLVLHNLNIKLANEDGGLVLNGLKKNEYIDQYFLDWDDKAYWFSLTDRGRPNYSNPEIQHILPKNL